MTTPFTMTGPQGKPVSVAQLEIGETVQAGDWYIVLGHLKADWYPAEPNLKLREFHAPHVRIVNPNASTVAAFPKGRWS